MKDKFWESSLTGRVIATMSEEEIVIEFVKIGIFLIVLEGARDICVCARDRKLDGDVYMEGG